MHGRPQDNAPTGFLTVREAAEVLGISTSAVRQRIKRGTLPVRKGDVTAGLEPRKYIPRGAVEEALKQKSHEQTQPANRYDVNSWSEAVLSRLDEAVEAASVQRNAIEKAVKDQDKHVSTRLRNVERNQEEIKAQVSEAVKIMREQADAQIEAGKLEQEYQHRMIEMLDREAERVQQRLERGLPERRSIWRRLFGT